MGGAEDRMSRSRRHTPEEARAEITRCAVEFLEERPFRELTVAKLMAAPLSNLNSTWC